MASNKNYFWVILVYTMYVVIIKCLFIVYWYAPLQNVKYTPWAASVKVPNVCVNVLTLKLRAETLALRRADYRVWNTSFLYALALDGGYIYRQFW